MAVDHPHGEGGVGEDADVVCHLDDEVVVEDVDPAHDCAEVGLAEDWRDG